MSAKSQDVTVISENPTIYECIGESDTLVDTLVQMLSELNDVEMCELTPLNNTVDMDALKHILGTEDKVTVSFMSNGYDITVSHKGRIRMKAA